MNLKTSHKALKDLFNPIDGISSTFFNSHHLEIEEDPTAGRISFRITTGGQTKEWVIDKSFFSGNPELIWEKIETDDMLNISLKNSTFPGTDLVADFNCKISPIDINVPTHTIAFSMKSLGINFNDILETLIESEEIKFLFNRIDDEEELSICTFPSGGDAVFVGKKGTGKLTTSWRFEFLGDKIIELKNLDVDLEEDIDISSDSLEIVLTTTSSMVLDQFSKKGTVLRILRGTSQPWDFKPIPRNLDIGILDDIKDSLFDIIYLQVFESHSPTNPKVVEQVFLAESQSSDKIVLRLSGEIKSIDEENENLKIRLENFTYIFDFNKREKLMRSHFVDRFWLSIKNFAIEIGDIKHPEYPLEVTIVRDTAIDGEPLSVNTKCSASLFKVISVLEGGTDLISQPTEYVDNTLITIVKNGGSNDENWISASSLRGDNSKIFLNLKDFSTNLLRREDLLNLKIEFENLVLQASLDKINLVQQDSSPSHMIVHFPAQNIVEEVIKKDTVVLPYDLPLKSASSSSSRLSFSITDPINYDVESILDWKRYAPELVTVANFENDDVPNGEIIKPEDNKPKANQTALELPWRLFISPNKMSGWNHLIKIATAQSLTGHLKDDIRFELWHTRLGVKKHDSTGNTIIDEDDRELKKIRAVWSHDLEPPSRPIPPDFETTLQPSDRIQIVRRSGESTTTNKPVSINVNSLMLSSLGAWLDLKGEWDVDTTGELDLVKWVHRSTMARDHYVEVVHSGRLCPFGQKAVYVVISERIFKNVGDNNTPEDRNNTSTAFIKKTHFICTKEPILNYQNLIADHFNNMFQNFVYRTVELENGCKVIDAPAPCPSDLPIDSLLEENECHFFPKINGKEVLFHIKGWDHDGKISDFVSPLMFIKEGHYEKGIELFLSSEVSLRKSDLSGQSIAFAPSGNKTGSTSFPTSSLTFSIEKIPATSISSSLLPFYPILDRKSSEGSAELILMPAEQIKDKKLHSIVSTEVVPVTYFKKYAEEGFSSKDELFLELVSSVPLDFKDNVTKSGGIATPDMSIRGLSREYGTVGGDLEKFVLDFDPKEYFSDAKLLGVISLSDIVAKIAQDDIDPESYVIPKLKTETKDGLIITQLEWKPWVVPELTAGIATFSFDNPKDSFELKIIITVGKDSESRVSVSGTISKCTLVLKDIIKVVIDQVMFSSSSNEKMKVNADISVIEFMGALNFVNELKNWIPGNGFKDGPRIDITPKEVSVGYSLPIPGIAVGAFAMDNIRLISSLKLPFDGRPLNYEFAFSDKSDPFIVTVSMLGGGGFFLFRMNIQEIIFFSAQVEFGACCAMTFGGAANGTLQVMAGIYLEKKAGIDDIPLTGFVRAKGELEVLGLINASVEFHMGLVWPSSNSAKNWVIIGTATVTIEVDTLCFTKDVRLTYERTFKYSASSFRNKFNDDTIQEDHFKLLMSLEDWEDYCQSFIPLEETLK